MIYQYFKCSSFTAVAFLLILLMVSCENFNRPTISIISSKDHSAPVAHGIQKLRSIMTSSEISFDEVQQAEDARGKYLLIIGQAAEGDTFTINNSTLPEKAESYAIQNSEWQNKPAWIVRGSDDRGLMYGLLEIADHIKRSDDVDKPLMHLEEQSVSPDVAERALSIYTMNREYWERRFYDENYWEKYLDNLARNRFNSLVVIFGYENGGFLAPAYPYFFDVEGFPDVYMEGHSAEEQDKNLEALNRLIEMAHNRGIDFSVGIWDHIYRGGVQSGGPAESEDAKYLVKGVTAENLVPYTKAGLRKFLEKVPHLDGLQLRIHWESGLTLEEQKTFFPEIFTMIKNNYPELRVDLRAKELPDELIANAIETGINYRIATKYWMEQMGMPYHPTNTNPEKSHRRHGYEDLLVYPKNYDVHWRLWNGGTTRVLLWGNPDYVKRFVKSTKLYDGKSFEVNEPLATKMEAQPHNAKPFELLNPEFRFYEYEFERYWYFFQVFGRIGYHAQTASEAWKYEFEERFGKEAAPILEKAINHASWVLPRIITSVYPYRMFPMTRGWAEKERLRDLPQYANSQFSDLPQFATFEDEAQLLLDSDETARMLPSENSHWFFQTADSLNQLISKAESLPDLEDNREFQTTLVDLKILSNLALYHARRIPAGVYYCLFEKTRNIKALEKAIEHERNAMEAWKKIAETAEGVYHDNLRMGFCKAGLCGHWKDELEALSDGIRELEKQAAEFEPTGEVVALPDYQPLENTPDESLFSINHTPVTQIEKGEPISVSIDIQSENKIKWVHLRHRIVNQEYDYERLPMIKKESGNYAVTIDREKIDTKWDHMYYFEIMDEKGNGIIYPDLEKETPYIFVKINRDRTL